MRHFAIGILIIVWALGTLLYKEVTVEDVLLALDEAGIVIEERRGTEGIYDLPREGTTQSFYQLPDGMLTIYEFASVGERKWTQRDPFPAATAVPPTGSYGMEKLLVFYYKGSEETAERLWKAFERFDAEDQEYLWKELDHLYARIKFGYAFDVRTIGVLVGACGEEGRATCI